MAQRICRYADVVGRERVIAGVDCGFETFAGDPNVDERIVYRKSLRSRKAREPPPKNCGRRPAAAAHRGRLVPAARARTEQGIVTMSIPNS